MSVRTVVIGLSAGVAAALASIGWSGAAFAFPGGTPLYQTDAAPYCAFCHSSLQKETLANLPPDRAATELAETKHFAVIRKGEGDYGKLTPEQREQLIQQIQALDAASTVKLTAPEKVHANETFKVTVDVTGGDGPACGVALLDGDQRLLARPAPAAGWFVVGPPTIIGQDFKQQTEWLDRRPQALGRNLSFVNVTGISSDIASKDWGRAQVIFTLRAPAVSGTYPLAAGYFYGTELATKLGTIEDPIQGRRPRGGFGGHSGRILFTPVHEIVVE
jgi:hypothetical protein